MYESLKESGNFSHSILASAYKYLHLPLSSLIWNVEDLENTESVPLRLMYTSSYLYILFFKFRIVFKPI